MLKKSSKELIDRGMNAGWVLEPEAKMFFRKRGLDTPASVLTASHEKARDFMGEIGKPVVIKAVSPHILHKSEHKAVVVGVSTYRRLKKEMDRLLMLKGCEAVLVEEMVTGIELIIGSKNDFQFGPVIVFGIGGTSVEIYNDTAIRMAPLKPGDVISMVETLKAKALLKGYRGNDGVNLEILTHLAVKFSHLVMELEGYIESIDLNPVICTKDRCVIADARMIIADGTDLYRETEKNKSGIENGRQ